MIIFVFLLVIIIVLAILLAYYCAYLMIQPDGILGLFGVFMTGTLILIVLFVILRLLFLGIQVLLERRKVSQKNGVAARYKNGESIRK